MIVTAAKSPCPSLLCAAYRIRLSSLTLSARNRNEIRSLKFHDVLCLYVQNNILRRLLSYVLRTCLGLGSAMKDWPWTKAGLEMVAFSWHLVPFLPKGQEHSKPPTGALEHRPPLHASADRQYLLLLCCGIFNQLPTNQFQCLSYFT